MSQEALDQLHETQDRMLNEFVNSQPEPDKSILIEGLEHMKTGWPCLKEETPDGYKCCLKPGHPGEHIAMGRIGTIFARWT